MTKVTEKQVYSAYRMAEKLRQKARELGGDFSELCHADLRIIVRTLEENGRIPAGVTDAADNYNFGPEGPKQH
jgi:hypothetical protein